MKTNKRVISYAVLFGLISGLDAKASVMDVVTPIFAPLPRQIHSDANCAASGVIKLEWNAVAGAAYIIENRPDLKTPWRLFSFEYGAVQSMRRSIVTRAPAKFFRISRMGEVALGSAVRWNLSFREIPADKLAKYKAVWNWDDGTCLTITGQDWFNSISKTYATAGIHTATVTVTATDGAIGVFQWAVLVVNFAPNLVPNSNFQTTSNSAPVCWFQGGYGNNTRSFTFPDQGMNGTGDFAATVTLSDRSSGDAKWYFADVNVAPNTEYIYGDEYKATVPSFLTVRFTSQSGELSYLDFGFPEASGPWASTRGSFVTPSDIKSVTVFHGIKQNGILTIDNTFLVKAQPDLLPLKEGMISFQFDDAWKDTYLNVNWVLAPDLHATFFVPSARIDDDGFLSRNDLMTIIAAGHEVGAHSVNHIDLAPLPEWQQEDEINFGIQDLLDSGVPKVTAFAYPFSSFDAKLEQLVREAGIRCAFISDSHLNAKGETSLYEIKRISVRSNMSLEYLESMIDQAASSRQWAIFVFHHVDYTSSDYSVSPQFFSQLVKYTRAKNVKVVTATEGACLMAN